MKTRNIIAIATALFTAGLAASATAEDAGAATNAPAQPVADTTMPVEAFPTNGIVLNFHNVPLSAVLNYLSAKAGLVIVSDANLQGAVSVVAKQPIGTNEVVDLLNEQLSNNNLTAVLEGRTLRIMDAERAKTLAGTPVKVDTNGPASIPVNDVVVTEIMPVQTLNPAQLVKDLDSLIPKNATVTANDAGSAVIMTAPQRDVRRISEIISALDSSSVSDVEVFVLKYADAKSVAAELKEVFQSADSEVTRATTRNNFAGRMRGGGGGFNPFGMGGGGGGGNNTEETKNAQTHAVFVSDDQMNAVVASAPPRLHALHHQCHRTIGSAKPGHHRSQGLPSSSTQTRLKSPANWPTCFPAPAAVPIKTIANGLPLCPAVDAATDIRESNKSARMKQQSSVLAVADRRTESVVVTASRDLMVEIKGMIDALDEGNQGITHVTAISLDSADPASVQQTIRSLFLNTGTASSSQTTTALSARTQGNNNSQSSSPQHPPRPASEPAVRDPPPSIEPQYLP